MYFRSSGTKFVTFRCVNCFSRGFCKSFLASFPSIIAPFCPISEKEQFTPQIVCAKCYSISFDKLKASMKFFPVFIETMF